MVYLLDTQIALWLILDDSRMPALARKRLGEADAEAVFHQVSLWEIQIKFDLGKLALPAPPSEVFPGWVSRSGLRTASIEDRGIFMLGKLPPIHRDPFDRLLVSHAIVNGWTMITADEIVKRYPVPVL